MNTLHCTATQCNTLQRSWLAASPMQHTVQHRQKKGNTLQPERQHVATRRIRCAANVHFWAFVLFSLSLALFCTHTIHWDRALPDSELRYGATLPRPTATHCNPLQRTAAHCNALQRTATHCSAMQRTVTHCNALQRTATHCNALQCIATHCNALQCTAIHCNTLQRTATHCNALQRTATHCNALRRTQSSGFRVCNHQHSKNINVNEPDLVDGPV